MTPRNRRNWVRSQEPFPVNSDRYAPVTLDASVAAEDVPDSDMAQLTRNVQFGRDAIVAFTALAGAKGLGGHTGGAYDIMLEGEILASLIRSPMNGVYPVVFDEAGHRVAYHYLRAAINGDISFGDLLHYREGGMGLPGHPEPHLTPGIGFAGGRLGHMANEVNGVALAHPDRAIFMLGSDGSQQEDRVAGAARFAVQQGLDVKWLIDANDVTIAGHTSDYFSTFSLEDTLDGHHIPYLVVEEPDMNMRATYSAIRAALLAPGPFAVILRRNMAPGIPGIEGTTKGHDVIPTDAAKAYLSARGLDAAVAAIDHATLQKPAHTATESDAPAASCRKAFGAVVADILDERGPDYAHSNVRIIDSDLEGSCGLDTLRSRHPDIYISGGINESGNFATAAAFGRPDPREETTTRQGIFATFGAFAEMTISEVTMALLNGSRALVHYSHTGVDDMADNRCHFGVNMSFLDVALEEESDGIRLYAFADANQLAAGVRAIFDDPGLRFVLTTRSATPKIINADGTEFFSAEKSGYQFRPGKDDVIRPGSDGYVVSYGECLYRALSAVQQARLNGRDVGLINKSTLNAWDPETFERLQDAPFVLFVESQNRRNGVGSRMGTELLKHGFHGQYDYLGSTRSGVGGLGRVQMTYQGLDAQSIHQHICAVARPSVATHGSIDW
ncbi:hypothetical protein AUJ68_05630 [Candidatus Woesearchaeota archaeon CG1_02_57_44]|nr:MAG: hypothetical protein AUJ68_05630 [Candidatus Woesearchaeota archaeon CG1_02_57_44]